jgi:hypothetical protein
LSQLWNRVLDEGAEVSYGFADDQRVHFAFISKKDCSLASQESTWAATRILNNRAQCKRLPFPASGQGAGGGIAALG